MTVGILSSIPRENLVFVPRRVNGQLRPGERCIATGAITRLTLPSSWISRPIEILNNTGAEVAIAATLGATISGNNVTNGTAFSGVSTVRVPIRGRATLTSTGSGWTATGCTGFLVFSYNGTPLAGNDENPLNASDLFHYLGIVQGGGTWTNPTGTPQLTAAASATESGTLASLTDRVASGQSDFRTPSVLGSWIGWRFPTRFQCTGFWLQTRGAFNSHNLRNFEIRVSDGPGLSTGDDITGWTVAQGYSNRAEITGLNAYFFFSIGSPIWGNRLAIRTTGLDSSGGHYINPQEWNLFGVCED